MWGNIYDSAYTLNGKRCKKCCEKHEVTIAESGYCAGKNFGTCGNTNIVDAELRKSIRQKNFEGRDVVSVKRMWGAKIKISKNSSWEDRSKFEARDNVKVWWCEDCHAALNRRKFICKDGWKIEYNVCCQSKGPGFEGEYRTRFIKTRDDPSNQTRGNKRRSKRRPRTVTTSPMAGLHPGDLVRRMKVLPTKFGIKHPHNGHSRRRSQRRRRSSSDILSRRMLEEQNTYDYTLTIRIILGLLIGSILIWFLTRKLWQSKPKVHKVIWDVESQSWMPEHVPYRFD